jgi:hypothetical protein
MSLPTALANQNSSAAQMVAALIRDIDAMEYRCALMAVMSLTVPAVTSSGTRTLTNSAMGIPIVWMARMRETV